VPAHVPVLIELDGLATTATKAALQAAGVHMVEGAGRSAGLARFVAGRIDRAALNNVLASSSVRNIQYVPPRGPLPLDHTTAIMNVASARGAYDGIDQVTGRGMLVADTDSNADVFHPHFFHADAGYFDWIDVNEDGRFDADIDAVDLDGDGQAGDGETAMLLTAATYSRHGTTVPARDMSFDPGLDWVYLDENANGQRDYGIDAGFDDSVPGFGEPLFVPDDVNQNGTLDVGERFVRLGTSKFRKVYTSVSSGYFVETRIYERGVDMTSHESDLTGGDGGGSDATHGTGVLSILLGDVPLVGRRAVGVAPEAEAVLVVDYSGDGATGAAWMLDEKPHVALWEMAPWTGLPLDGTDAYSKLVDATTEDDGVAHACPVGNTGGSRKHAQLALPAGQATVLPFENPPDLAATYGQEPTYVQASLNIRGAEGLEVRLRVPNGTEMPVTDKAGEQTQPMDGLMVYPTVQTTERGTYFVDVILYAYKAPQIGMPKGQWELVIEGHATDDATLDAYVMDEVSRWSPGVVFPGELASDVSTIGAPAVADHCIAVGAFTGHPTTTTEPWFHGDEPAGQVRGYSGRGPRIDGAERLDIVAPDNPFAAAPHVPDYLGLGEIPHGSFWVFGGTSGAGPHVAGVAALLAQTGVRGLAAKEAIREGAQRDPTTSSDPEAYGAGRLDAAGALGAEPMSAPPSVDVAMASPAVVGQQVQIDLTVFDPTHPKSALEARWDDGYDGSWDTEYESASSRAVVHEQIGRYPYKVRVRNPDGRVAEAVVWVEVKDAPVTPPDAGAPDAGGTGTGGSPGGSNQDPAANDAAAGLEPGGGCGCRVTDGGTNGTAGAIVVFMGAVASLVRRRKVLPVIRCFLR